MNIELNIDASRARTDEERQNVETFRRYIEVYNDLVPGEVAAWAKTFYHPDCRIWVTRAGYEGTSGHDKLIPVVEKVAELVPSRRASIQNVYPFHDMVVAEGMHLVLDHPDFASPWCTFLTFEDGRIVEEHTHVDPTGFPGLEEAYEETSQSV